MKRDFLGKFRKGFQGSSSAVELSKAKFTGLTTLRHSALGVLKNLSDFIFSQAVERPLLLKALSQDSKSIMA